MRPYLITAKLMGPSNMKRFPTLGQENVVTEGGLDKPQRSIQNTRGKRMMGWNEAKLKSTTGSGEPFGTRLQHQ
jgi:hypothetical protein